MKITYQLTFSNWGSFPAPHFVIRGIPSSIRPPIRHSGEGRNPEGVGRGKTNDGKNSRAVPFSSSYAAFARPWSRISKRGGGDGANDN